MMSLQNNTRFYEELKNKKKERNFFNLKRKSSFIVYKFCGKMNEFSKQDVPLIEGLKISRSLNICSFSQYG